MFSRSASRFRHSSFSRNALSARRPSPRKTRCESRFRASCPWPHRSREVIKSVSGRSFSSLAGGERAHLVTGCLREARDAAPPHRRYAGEAEVLELREPAQQGLHAVEREACAEGEVEVREAERVLCEGERSVVGQQREACRGEPLEPGERCELQDGEVS